MTKKVVISPTVLGRKAAEYGRLRVAQVAEERIEERIVEDAGILGIKLEEYKAQLAEIGKKSVAGKRALLKERKGKIQALHLTTTSFLNEILLNGTTDLPALQSNLKELAEEAKGWVLMTAVDEDKSSGSVLFTINDSGWEDGSNRSNQYSDRPQMVGKSGKRVIHPFQIHGTTPDPSPAASIEEEAPASEDVKVEEE